MPKMRIMSWVLFTLALAFFSVRDFRWALQMPYLEARVDWDSPGIPQANGRSPEFLLPPWDESLPPPVLHSPPPRV